MMTETKRTDQRKVGNDILEQNRFEVIRLWKAKKKQADIASELNVSIGMVCQTIKKYKNGGYNLSCLKSKNRGRAIGEKRSLTFEQERELMLNIIETQPSMEMHLWTRESIALRILSELKIKMPLRTLSEYMRRWGMAEPFDKSVDLNIYEKIQEIAKQENALIYYMDEIELIDLPGMEPADFSDVLNDQKNKNKDFNNKENISENQSDQNQNEGELSLRRSRLRALRAMTPRGKSFFRIYKSPVNAPEKFNFIDMLVKDSNHKIIVALSPELHMSDGPRAKQIIRRNKGKIIFAFPERYRIPRGMKGKIRGPLSNIDRKQIQMNTAMMKKTLQKDISIDDKIISNENIIEKATDEVKTALHVIYVPEIQLKAKKKRGRKPKIQQNGNNSSNA